MAVFRVERNRGYRVKLHFSETSKETMTDKIKRLILNDCAKEFEQSEKIS